MKFRSENMTAASGSIGGVTYAHARGGQMYRRARSSPVNPNTSAQQRARTDLAAASARWNELTVEERLLWTAYALATPVAGAFGQQQTLTGQQMFVRINSVRMALGYAMTDDAPTTPGNVELGEVTFEAFDSQANMPLTWTAGRAWNTEGGGLLLRLSPFRPPGCAFIKSPLQIALAYQVPATPVLTTNVSQNAWGETTDGRLNQCLGYSLRALAADGRISETFYGTIRVGTI